MYKLAITNTMYIVNSHAGTYKKDSLESFLYFRAKLVFLIINDSKITPQNAKLSTAASKIHLSLRRDNKKYAIIAKTLTVSNTWGELLNRIRLTIVITISPNTYTDSKEQK